jgi:hypothetical protein
VPGAFPKVSGHSVAVRPIFSGFAAEANVFTTSFKVWCWVDDKPAFSFHDERTLDDRSGSFPDLSISTCFAIVDIRSISAFLAWGSPRVGKSDWTRVDINQVRSVFMKIISFVVVKITTETVKFTVHLVVDFDENVFSTVPFDKDVLRADPDDNVVGSFFNAHQTKSGWESKNSVVVVGFWETSSSVMTKMEVKTVERHREGPFTSGGTIAVPVVVECDRKGLTVSSKDVRTLTAEPVHTAVKRPIVVLAPSHTVTLLIFWNSFPIKNAVNKTGFFLDSFSSLDTFRNFVRWHPAFRLRAPVVAPEWNDVLEDIRFVALWPAEFIAGITVNLTVNKTVFWSS